MTAPEGPPRPRARLSSDPWARTPTEELQDQVLPRWFVLLAIGAVIAAVVVLVIALSASRRDRTPLLDRRPPPAGGFTHDIGEVEIGDAEPVPYDNACPDLEGVRIAGSSQDQATLRRGLAALCNVAPDEVTAALRDFAGAGGVVRFAAFGETGVDSTATTAEDPPQILLNARFSRSGPLLLAPLVAHDVIARQEPGDAATELAARQQEAAVCEGLFDQPPRSCADALEIRALPDAIAGLRAAGYR